MRSVVTAAAMVGVAIAVSPPASAAPSWTMPNLIGMDLQGAQDAIQTVSGGQVWFRSSTDLTGQDRAQLSDRNWQVCRSTPAPGATFTVSTKIGFGVVRVDSEECP